MENVLITGITGGIGYAVAEKLLENGSSVLGVARNTQAAQETLSSRYGDRIHTVDFDLTQVNMIDDLIKELVAGYGPIGGLVHCAGFDKMAPLHLVKSEDMEQLWRIHAQVPMRMIGLISKKKNRREDTSIVLIGSQAAHEGAMGHTAYAAAKGALEGYLAPAAAELMEKGMRINEVCLAPVETAMSASWMSKMTPEQLEDFKRKYPLGFCSPEKVADVICFLLSDQAKYMTGQMITVDGGHAVRKV